MSIKGNFGLDRPKGLVFVLTYMKFQGESESGHGISISGWTRPEKAISMIYTSSGVKIWGQSESELGMSIFGWTKLKNGVLIIHPSSGG